MDTLLNPWTLTALVVGLTFSLGLMLRTARVQARRIAGLEATLREERKAREALALEIAAVLACSRELGERLRQQGQKQKTVTDKLNVLAQQVEGQQAVTQAERLLSKGLAVEQISEMCALSRGEAALLERWKQRSNAA